MREGQCLSREREALRGLLPPGGRGPGRRPAEPAGPRRSQSLWPAKSPDSSLNPEMTHKQISKTGVCMCLSVCVGRCVCAFIILFVPGCRSALFCLSPSRLTDYRAEEDEKRERRRRTKRNSALEPLQVWGLYLHRNKCHNRGSVIINSNPHVDTLKQC